ncbi:hypothetical protein [Actinoplanes sp. GCM10030250]|uniref:hypothetical protein n=1 Tax=Actinoplanes sp. GCM10030250 TaxID=3273376 RepID=UPI00361A766F
MNQDLNLSRTSAPRAGRVMCADSLGRTLLAMAVPPAQRRGGILRRVPTLGRRCELPEELRREVLAADAVDQAVPLAHVQHIDAEAVASWIVAQYPAAAYPAVVLGSPHGAAVHLAAACGAAWLPTTFTVTVPWPGGSPANWVGAMVWGTRLAERILDTNPGVTVRQVHDPVARGALCGATVSLQIRWQTVPAAYRTFLRSRVVPGGASVLARDLRTWPVLDGPAGYSFQVGSPTSGWTPDDYSVWTFAAHDWPAPGPGVPRQYAETSGEPAIEPELRRLAAGNGSSCHRLLYTDPHVLSACVADLYRDWQPAPAGERHAVVGAGRMTDPWQVVDGGMVPYWCESSASTATETAEMWLAASMPFDRISVLPDPPGALFAGTATLSHWRAIARFAGRGGAIDRYVAGRYPLLPSAAGHATRYLQSAVPGRRRPAPMIAGDAVRHLSGTGSRLGLLVT